MSVCYYHQPVYSKSLDNGFYTCHVQFTLPSHTDIVQAIQLYRVIITDGVRMMLMSCFAFFNIIWLIICKFTRKLLSIFNLAFIFAILLILAIEHLKVHLNLYEFVENILKTFNFASTMEFFGRCHSEGWRHFTNEALSVFTVKRQSIGLNVKFSVTRGLILDKTPFLNNVN